jgi:hypothetical protein
MPPAAQPEMTTDMQQICSGISENKSNAGPIVLNEAVYLTSFCGDFAGAKT